MRTLAPIRVRQCDLDGHRLCGHQRWVCRICAATDLWMNTQDALWAGLYHLRNEHPWPWSEAQLDTDGSGK